jgi:hypothetical protein
MILLHGEQKNVPIQSTRFGEHEGRESGPKPIELALTCQAPASIVVGVADVELVVSAPSFQFHEDSKPASHTQHFQHDGAAMGMTLPRAKRAEDTPINVSFGVGSEDLVRYNFASGDKLIKEAPAEHPDCGLPVL